MVARWSQNLELFVTFFPFLRSVVGVAGTSVGSLPPISVVAMQGCIWSGWEAFVTWYPYKYQDLEFPSRTLHLEEDDQCFQLHPFVLMFWETFAG